MGAEIKGDLSSVKHPFSFIWPWKGNKGVSFTKPAIEVGKTKEALQLFTCVNRWPLCNRFNLSLVCVNLPMLDHVTQKIQLRRCWIHTSQPLRITCSPGDAVTLDGHDDSWVNHSKLKFFLLTRELRVIVFINLFTDSPLLLPANCKEETCHTTVIITAIA